MARKKFAIRSLFSGRAAKSGVDEEVAAEYASESDDLNDAHPFDPTQVNRPPRLDDRTEAELRRACAFIVENLKPSGYDLEDTRMQSDILVDNPDLNNPRGYPSKPKPTVPQPDATWYLDASTRSSQFVNPRHVVKSPDNRASTYRISGIASEHDVPPERYSKHLDPNDPHRPIDHTESPRAPLASGALPSRDLASPPPKQVSHVKSVMDPQNPSSSSVVSDNGPASSSTTATSTTYTPSSTSKRASDNAKMDATAASAASTSAGKWMKDEVDKRINAGRHSRSAISTRDSNLSSDDPSSSSHMQLVGEAQAVQIRSGQMLKSSHDQVRLTDVRSPTSASQAISSPKATAFTNTGITSGTLSGPFEQPHLVEESSTPVNPRKAPEPSSEQPRDAAQLAEEYQNSIATDRSPIPIQRESLPSSKSPSAATSSRQVSTVLNRPISVSSQKSDSSKRGSKALSPTSPISPGFPKSPQNWPAPPKPVLSEEQIPQIPPIPDKHQLDESIVVKDFYKPNGSSRMKLYRRSATSDRYPAQPGDVEAADFDSFMSVVKHSSRPNTAASKAESIPAEPSARQATSKLSDNSTPAATSRPISSGESLPPPKDIENSAKHESATEAIGSTSRDLNQDHPPSLPQSQRSPAQDPKTVPVYNLTAPRATEPKELPPQDQQRQPLSPAIISATKNEVSSPAIVSSRSSISTPVPVSSHSRSASISKRNRGLKRLLSKLGSNDRPAVQVNGYTLSRRKYVEGFAPGAYIPGHGINGGIEENDEWFDEQACAAPVVGFGRGW